MRVHEIIEQQHTEAETEGKNIGIRLKYSLAVILPRPPRVTATETASIGQNSSP